MFWVRVSQLLVYGSYFLRGLQRPLHGGARQGVASNEVCF